MGTVRFLTGIGYVVFVPFRRVASAARVYEVVVITCQFGGLAPRGYVVDRETVVAVGNPAFAAQAIDATELKLVTKPGFVRPVIPVTLGTVPPLA